MLCRQWRHHDSSMKPRAVSLAGLWTLSLQQRSLFTENVLWQFWTLNDGCFLFGKENEETLFFLKFILIIPVPRHNLIEGQMLTLSDFSDHKNQGTMHAFLSWMLIQLYLCLFYAIWRKNFHIVSQALSCVWELSLHGSQSSWFADLILCFWCEMLILYWRLGWWTKSTKNSSINDAPFLFYTINPRKCFSQHEEIIAFHYIKYKPLLPSDSYL